MIKLNNPFIKLVDRTHTQTLINEQIMGLSGQTTDKTAVNAGELIGVKAILTGKLISFSKIKKPIKKEVKKLGSNVGLKNTILILKNIISKANMTKSPIMSFTAVMK